jgi:hypothetical protein
MSIQNNSKGVNSSITADIELQGWVKELKEKLTTFPDITNQTQLIKALTTVIYTGKGVPPSPSHPLILRCCVVVGMSID